MKKTGNVVSLCLCILCAMAVCVLAARTAKAQNSAQDEPKITTTAADQQAAVESSLVYRHAKPANTPAGATLKKRETTAGIRRPNRASTANSTAAASTDGGLRFPGDVTYFGGQVVVAAQAHAIFLRPNNGMCGQVGPCWGNPENFLRDLSISDFIHVADQYVGLAARNRYTVGDHAFITFKPTPKTAPLTDADVQAFVHAVAATQGAGYGHIYHVFLPPGQDECFDAASGICYSPDVPETFFFCGYHSSVDFKDIGHVLYSVEPYQNVPGCQVRPGTPNGELIDSTNNTLSHEQFETITDPDGDAWFNFTDVALAGAEIADECSFFTIDFTAGQTFFDPSVFTIGRHVFAVQPEYSNMEHACAAGR